MSHSSSIESLNPILKQALSHLDVRLEDELARYRRRRAGLQGTPVVIKPITHRSTAPELPCFGAALTPASQPSTSASPKHQAASTQSISYTLGDGAPQQQLASQTFADQMQPSSFALALSEIEASGQSLWDSEPDKAEVSHQRPVQAVTEAAPPPIVASVLPNTVLPKDGDTSKASSLEQSVDCPEEWANFLEGAAELPIVEDGYSASSEALLRSLETTPPSEKPASPKPHRPVKFNPLKGLANPLGVCSAAILLSASAIFGYLMIRPTTFGGGSDRLSARKPSGVTQPILPPANPTNPEDSSNSPLQETPAVTPPEAQNPPLSNTPPLDAQEFLDLDLQNLTVLKTEPQGMASPSPIPQFRSFTPGVQLPTPDRPALASQPRVSLATPLPASPWAAPPVLPAPVFRSAGSSYGQRLFTPRETPYSPSNVTAAISPRVHQPSLYRSREGNRYPRAADPTPPKLSLQTAKHRPVTAADPLPPVSISRVPKAQAAPPPSSANSRYSYKVEVPYTGDQSLEAARKVVPDAYLRSDGKIQLGTAGSSTEAQQKIQTLQSQGIAAQANRR